MKVRELQEQLRKLDPTLEVFCYCEDEQFLASGRGFIVLDIVAAKATEAEQLRLDDGTPYLKFGKSPTAAAIATLEVTTDF